MTPTQDTSRLDYLRDRPFLVITPATRPAPGVHTETAGWMKDPANLDRQERPSLAHRIGFKVLCEASVIIDIERGSTVKNRTPEAEAEVIARYHHLYAHLLA